MSDRQPIPAIDNLQRWAWLGLARFILASIVAATHLGGFVKAAPISFIGSAAFEAILGFLAISGFSIAHSYHSRPVGYFKRRVLRIYPVFAASFVASCLVFYFVDGIVYTPFAIAANLLFLNGLVTPVSIVWGSWTLAVEVWLYCLAPILARQSFQRINWFIWASFAFYVAYTCGRTVFDWSYFSNTSWGIGFVCLAFCWLAGWNLRTAPAESEPLMRRTLVWLFVGVMALRLGIGVAHQFRNHTLSQEFLGHGVQVLWASLVLVGVQYLLFSPRLPALSPKAKAAFSFLGNISYPLYLIHLVAFTLVGKRWNDNVLILVLSALVSSTALYFAFDWYSQRRERPAPRPAA